MNSVSAGVTARRSAVVADPIARYERMVEIRRVEEAIVDLFKQGKVPGTTHTAQGQEAVAVAVAAVTRPSDPVSCTYRGHGHALALGLNFPPFAIASDEPPHRNFPGHGGSKGFLYYTSQTTLSYKVGEVISMNQSSLRTLSRW